MNMLKLMQNTKWTGENVRDKKEFLVPCISTVHSLPKASRPKQTKDNMVSGQKYICSGKQIP